MSELKYVKFYAFKEIQYTHPYVCACASLVCSFVWKKIPLMMLQKE